MFSVSLVGLSADALSRTAVLRCSGRLGPSGAVGTGQMAAPGPLLPGSSHVSSPTMGPSGSPAVGELLPTAGGAVAYGTVYAVIPQASGMRSAGTASPSPNQGTLGVGTFVLTITQLVREEWLSNGERQAPE
ncbi:unnamed protein product [Arctogadus glacialis]